MTWIKIDKDNLPKGEVLAANFSGNDEHGRRLVGELATCYYNGRLCVRCRDINDDAFLADITHYIDINAFDLPKP